MKDRETDLLDEMSEIAEEVILEEEEETPVRKLIEFKPVAPPSSPEKLLSEKQLYALIVVSEKQDEFRNDKLSTAVRELQQVEQQIAFWQQQREVRIAGLNEVQGAIKGCEALIIDELAKYGVSRETFERQKSEHYTENAPKE